MAALSFVFYPIYGAGEEWESKRMAFGGVPLDLFRSWAVFLKGSWHAKSVHRVSWMSPIDVLKLNFDIALFDPL